MNHWSKKRWSASALQAFCEVDVISASWSQNKNSVSEGAMPRITGAEVAEA
ncbi:hypothetical protein JDW15_02190 [Aerococcaceae bacterium zg-ZJ1578]|uniref:hypothetical protein n=1 Tax=Aerococcaceae bacterium zg-252 TaxID=2796928 RepID=UPI001A1E2B35|nr:hypothetical protein [Aerococcaceae bacterium zg-1578]